MLIEWLFSPIIVDFVRFDTLPRNVHPIDGRITIRFDWSIVFFIYATVFVLTLTVEMQSIEDNEWNAEFMTFSAKIIGPIGF